MDVSTITAIRITESTAKIFWLVERRGFLGGLAIVDTFLLERGNLTMKG
jgi:hypothetical protein